MTWLTATLKNPDLTSEQRTTLERLIRLFGVPFACSLVAGTALPTWQNIGTVRVRCDGEAQKVHNGQKV
jgi:hypothetical protein